MIPSELVMHYAASLVHKICGGTCSKVVKFELEKDKKLVSFNPDSTQKLTGVKIENESSKTILEKLGFIITDNDGGMDVTVPSWRPDIDGVNDIVEEIIRINGYQHIPSTKLPRKIILRNLQ